ncbi:MAG: hypothetical protein IKQ24_03065 [Verrucomicrobia bacterium]|nr:hypothetical protein [Verrucomicrobiota bacterium]
MTKTKKTILTIVGIVFLALISPIILFVGIFAASLIGDAMITQKDVEKYGKKMQPQSGMVFPADTTFVNGYWVKYCIFQERGAGWKYTSKEPFQLPENAKFIVRKRSIDEIKERYSKSFKTNITDVTRYLEAEWMTNGFVFSADMLETPERYYLNLSSYVPRSYELENPEEYGLPSQ